MRLVTWNVNSVTARLPRLLDWLGRQQPDVVCLQETKVGADAFPAGEVAALGYQSVHHGEGRWNGVAILSRVGLDDVRRGLLADPRGADAEARAMAATCAGVRVWSVYVPNGRTLEDPHYAYKLAWLAELRRDLAAELAEHPTLACSGDYNVARTDTDVWDPAAFVGSTHVSAAERRAVDELVALGLADVLADSHAHDPDGVPSTYWDYRAGAFHKRMGMRIDLVLASAPLAGAVARTWVDREARKIKGGEGAPSDHAPVVVDLALPAG